MAEPKSDPAALSAHVARRLAQDEGATPLFKDAGAERGNQDRGEPAATPWSWCNRADHQRVDDRQDWETRRLTENERHATPRPD